MDRNYVPGINLGFRARYRDERHGIGFIANRDVYGKAPTA